MTDDLRTRAEQSISHLRWGAQCGTAIELIRDLLAALDATEQREQALREQLAEAERRAFEAGFLAGVNCVDKFGEQNDTAEDAYRAYQQSRQG